MKIKHLILLVMALLIIPAVSWGGEVEVDGSLDLGFRAVAENGNSAKFDEYQDRDDGFFGDAVLRSFRGTHFLEINIENPGLDDESHELQGGRFGSFNYSLFYDQIPHRLSKGSQTFYAGIGSENLLDTGNSTNTALWTEFDYEIERRGYGAEAEVSLNSPFYVQFGARQLETTGVMPTAGNSTFSSFGRMTELPAPVDWKTNNFFAKTGYRTKGLLFSVKGEFSEFENHNDYLFWKDTFGSTTLSDVTSLAPDSDYWKVSAQGVVRLPLDSTLAVRGSYARMENDLELISTVPDGASTTVLTLNRDTFAGDITYSTFDAALNSRSVKPLDVKLYYKYLDKNNDNSIVSFSSGGSTVETEVFEYDKHYAGIDVGYRLPARTKVDLGYEFRRVDRRERPDAESTTDHKLYVQLRNSALDVLEARVKYEHLERSSDFDNGTAGTDLTDDASIRRFVRRFDATHKKGDKVELGLELYPVEHLDLALEYAYMKDDFDETTLGRDEETRHEVYLDVAYEMPEMIKLSGFLGYEHSETEQDQRRYSPGDNTDPATGTVGAAYNWEEEKTFDTWAYGLMAEVPLLKEKIDFVVSWNHQDVDGEADFSTEGASPLVDIDEVDDYTKKELELKCICRVAQNLDMTLGYLYEKYKFHDAQFDSYVFAPNTSTLLSGAYADNDYEANIGYLMASYRF